MVQKRTNPLLRRGPGDGDNTRKKLPSPGRIQQQQQQLQTPQQPPATTTGMATLQTAHSAQSQNPYQHFQQPYMHQQQQHIVNQPQTQRSITLGFDRSITAAGGITAIGGPSQVEKPPEDTGKFSYHDLCPLFPLFYLDNLDYAFSLSDSQCSSTLAFRFSSFLAVLTF